MKKGIVILGFGGVGKTELSRKYKNVIDLESIFWKWKYNDKIEGNIECYKRYENRSKNTHFPTNYIEAIKENQQKYDIVLVAYSDIICKSLKENKIEYYLCYPEKGAKDIYIERYKGRGNNEEFIKRNIESFEEAIDIAEKREATKIVLYGDETLEDYLIKSGYNLKLYNKQDKKIANIILTSNGFNNETNRSKKIDKMFEQVSKGKDVVIILNATKGGSNVQNIEGIKSNFEKVGARKVELLTINNENQSEIFKYDIIYTMEGDPRILLDDFYEYNFKIYLMKFLEKGIYIGESAGAMILCNNLKWVWDIKKGTKPKYDILPKTFEGLNLINEKIYPHYNKINEEQKIKTEKYEKENNMEITKLCDGEFILKNKILN